MKQALSRWLASPTSERAHWLEGASALVAGLGPVGLLAAMILRLRGADVIGMDIVDPSSPRAKILEAMGGKYLHADEVKKQKPDIEVIIEAAGVPKVDFDLLEILGINGIFVLTGVPGDSRCLDINGATIMRRLVLKNQVMVGSVNESLDHFRMGIKDLCDAQKRWPGAIEKMITGVVPHERFGDVFAKHSPDEIKVVIDWS